MAAVTLTNVVKRFGTFEVVHGANIDIADGEFVVFVGPSGCGKSTLLRMVAGLEDISGGEIAIGGKVVNDVEPADRGIAMVFQSYALYPHMTVEQNLSFGLRMNGNPKADTERRVKRAAEILCIDELMQRRPKQLSGGQRQRVAIGRAIVREPQVFLFDEPLSNLDAELRVQMRVEISRLHKELGVTMIYVTHDQTEAMTLADRIVVLKAGNVEQIGAPLDLYDDPANRFVAGFIGSPKMNFIAAKVVDLSNSAATVELVNHGGARLRKPLCGPLPAPGAEVVLGVRPEHFFEAGEGDCDISVKADVAEHLGSVSYVYADAGPEELIIEREARRQRAGSDHFTVSIKPERSLLFDKTGARIR
ncbi:MULTISPECIES: sn-glycerol-3-phosphate ABC transporter ATP-binding protein UgpC [unclassified Mesorhizobium]|uniref:ABC transporter ATP-binding protein n=1 Tax=unclassified Mesorhizobium TaxID=325217 RepID=UPI000BAEE758|nr:MULTISPECIES: sn-glycerol-3-phosphate ABC transporter ATP-binding protein UgpC [unclassified Mesorhizobium]PBB31362.1 sugar ABC transporter ATP-binding protein [Mesorhizobium sp. WSM3882]RUV06060.1 sn-glycerol-3-phosphate ABC transporter ATP-binding protein UgpC [Mesorhizobium sp. M1A.F.Ca.IN.020.03.2.1]RUV85449.1 sn-glycerol-3-phosphate ABC transporter ATP-binding protein UgpC [Mesorhizobium sp. M1A.F.Ca.IN.020.32.1.1]RUW09602.1 sn-glycerol-3-phosphate ABC transporter ATP-binding protein Ug